MRADLIERLRERAASYRLGGPSSEHTALMLEEAADALASQEPAYWTVITTSGTAMGICNSKAEAQAVNEELSLTGTITPLFTSPASQEPVAWDKRYPSVFFDVTQQHRISVSQFKGNDTITFGWLLENKPGGAWYEQEYTADEARQLAFAILSKPSVTSPVVPVAAKAEADTVFEIEHDGFKGTVLKTPEGRPCIYVTREGKRGRVLQQIGTKIVHVYGEKWLKPAAPTCEGEGT